MTKCATGKLEDFEVEVEKLQIKHPDGRRGIQEVHRTGSGAVHYGEERYYDTEPLRPPSEENILPPGRYLSNLPPNFLEKYNRPQLPGAEEKPGGGIVGTVENAASEALGDVKGPEA